LESLKGRDHSEDLGIDGKTETVTLACYLLSHYIQMKILIRLFKINLDEQSFTHNMRSLTIPGILELEV
jgi:hypothetical protein